MANRSFLTLLLVFAIAHFAPVAVPGANALQGMNLAPPTAFRRAEHNQLAGRMIRKRQTNRATGTETNTGPSDTAPTGNGNTTPTPTGQTTTGNGGSTTSQSQTSTTDNTNTRTSTTSTASTPTSTSTTPPPTSNSPTAQVPTTAPTTTSGRTTSTLTRTQTSAAATGTDDKSSNPDASFLPKPAIIGLIVTGSCIAAAAAIWTIIRKWKFSPSRHFEDRLEPINWEPTQSSGLPHDPTVAALARGGSQNGGSQNGRTRNSLSSDGQGSVRNMSAANNDQISMAPDFPPPHDFTAGAASLGPPGGYVDMHRGPSPGPNPYAQRGPSPAPPGPYGQQYEAPNPYDAYDYNAGYGQRRY